MNHKLLLAATLLGSVSIAATATARPMTPEDIAKLESVGAIAVSPDGTKVAFTTSAMPDVTEGEDNGSSKRTLNIATGPNSARVYLPEDVSPAGVTFSPDGSMVSFNWKHDDDDDRAVWGIPVDGGAQRKLAAVKDSGVRSHAWSPDGSTLYMLVGAEDDKQRDKQKKGGFNAVVYEEEARLNRMFSAKVGMDVDEEPSEIAVPGYVSAFQIAPNGTNAIVETAPTPNVDDGIIKTRVNIINLASGGVTVVETPGKIGDVEISPDSKRMSLIAGVDKNDPAATTLHMVDMATGAITAVNSGAAEAIVDTEFLSDGTLATVVHKGASSFMRMYGKNGRALQDVSAGGLAITGLDAGGKRIVVRASTAAHPSELFAFSNGTFTRWTNHNDWLSEISMGKQSVVTYTARDGQDVEGILIEPVGGAPAGGAPLIMNVHGGPEAHENNGWVTAYSKPGQVAAGQGYAVFLPNYRGSTGYGVAFAKQHQADYAGKEFNDIVDAKRHLVAQGIADADRTGITGGSYGGYASAWGATALSAEYAASVMFVGISNQISKFGTTDIPVEMFNVHSRKWPWEDWQGMLEVSPIYHVEKAETPILIMHGAEDPRVAPSQSYELYRNIKVRKPDTPVRLVLYPGEGHGNRKAAARYDYNLRMMRWFDTYLKTGDRKAAIPASRPELAEGAKGASKPEDN